MRKEGAFAREWRGGGKYYLTSCREETDPRVGTRGGEEEEEEDELVGVLGTASEEILDDEDCLDAITLVASNV